MSVQYLYTNYVSMNQIVYFQYIKPIITHIVCRGILSKLLSREAAKYFSFKGNVHFTGQYLPKI